jgi:hypothetical protein
VRRREWEVARVRSANDCKGSGGGGGGIILVVVVVVVGGGVSYHIPSSKDGLTSATVLHVEPTVDAGQVLVEMTQSLPALAVNVRVNREPAPEVGAVHASGGEGSLPAVYDTSIELEAVPNNDKAPWPHAGTPDPLLGTHWWHVMCSGVVSNRRGGQCDRQHGDDVSE